MLHLFLLKVGLSFSPIFSPKVFENFLYNIGIALSSIVVKLNVMN
jgi:hypothetical protein